MYTYPEALNAMEKIAYDLCKAAFPNTDFYVRVIADGVTGTASVDWSWSTDRKSCYVTINMPVRKATYRMGADEFRHWAAYLLHEVGHPFETDKPEWQKAVREGRHKLVNYLEDVREEKATIARGIAKNAVKVFSELVDMLHAKTVAEGYDPNAVQSIGWTLATLGRHANGYAIDISDIKRKLDPNGIVGRIVPWALVELDQTTSTLDVRTLADKVIKAVNDAMRAERDALKLPEPEVEEIDPEPRPEPQGGMSETRGEPEPEPEEQADNSPTIPKEPEQEDVPAPAGKAEGDGEGEPGKGDGAVSGSPEDRADDVETSPEPEEELFTDDDIEEVDTQPTSEGNLQSNSKDLDTQRRITRMLRRTLRADAGLLNKPISGRNHYGSVDIVTGDASKMGRQRALLARAMKATDHDDFDGGRTHGRINRRDMYKLTTGATTIFGKRTATEGYDTDVQILVDASGSMAGVSILAAASLALVVAQAASQVGVDCYAHTFNDDGLAAMTMGKAKPVARKFAYAVNQVGGGTPLTENILLVSQLQHKRAGNKRRILFVITDGGCNHGAKILKAGADYVETLGTEIANLHIGHQVMGVFRNEVAVNVGNVRETGLKQLTAVLERGAS